ncbi:hypothetical protein SDC9_182458 [bioreactor metagenome]|uniref:Uncharacterized protein n=1 Tax=bioreactor metagenome TaxID=1076179 RepID=A0A645HFT0_9ZZZZ
MSRGASDIRTFLENHFHHYVSDIKVAIKKDNLFLGAEFVTMLEKKIPLIEEFCNRIVEVSKKYRLGLIKDSYIEAYELFDDMYQYFLSAFSWKESNGYFYRLRAGDFRITDTKESKMKKTELFHIKSTNNNLIVLIGIAY